jgi:hypothetical protein
MLDHDRMQDLANVYELNAQIDPKSALFSWVMRLMLQTKHL